jgi:hypothetical protein
VVKLINSFSEISWKSSRSWMSRKTSTSLDVRRKVLESNRRHDCLRYETGSQFKP